MEIVILLQALVMFLTLTGVYHLFKVFIFKTPKEASFLIDQPIPDPQNYKVIHSEVMFVVHKDQQKALVSDLHARYVMIKDDIFDVYELIDLLDKGELGDG